MTDFTGSTAPAYNPIGGYTLSNRIFTRAFVVADLTATTHDLFLVSGKNADLPLGAVVTDGYIVLDDLDSNGTPTISSSLGILQGPSSTTTTDPDAYLLTNTAGQAGGMARFDGDALQNHITLQAGDTVTLTNTVGSATAQAGTATVYISYYVL